MIADLFASAAEAEAIPPSHWTRPVDAGDDWCTFLGPHRNWDAFRLATQPWEDVPVHRGKDGFRASVCVARDRTTGLWVFGVDADGPVSSEGGPPGYDHRAFQSRDAALSVGRALALEKMAGHAATYADYLRRERVQVDASRRAHLARIAIEPGDETGEEGMADRFEDDA